MIELLSRAPRETVTASGALVRERGGNGYTHRIATPATPAQPVAAMRVRIPSPRLNRRRSQGLVTQSIGLPDAALLMPQVANDLGEVEHVVVNELEALADVAFGVERVADQGILGPHEAGPAPSAPWRAPPRSLRPPRRSWCRTTARRRRNRRASARQLRLRSPALAARGRG